MNKVLIINLYMYICEHILPHTFNPGYFVVEHVGMPFWKFFLRRTQPGTAFWNLLFLG
jgi:hypothetical protein